MGRVQRQRGKTNLTLRIDMNGHTGILGITRSGKTKLGTYLFDKVGGFFMDIKNMGEVTTEITLTRRTRPEVFDKVVSTVNKIRYVPSADPDKATKEAEWIVKRLLSLNISKHIWVDELQNYGGSRKNAFDPIATQGLGAGLHLNWLTQRPAKASKTIASQTDTLIFFDMSSFEKKYFNEYELPYEEIKAKMQGQPKHYFIVYTRGKGLSEPYKVLLPTPAE